MSDENFYICCFFFITALISMFISNLIYSNDPFGEPMRLFIIWLIVMVVTGITILIIVLKKKNLIEQQDHKKIGITPIQKIDFSYHITLKTDIVQTVNLLTILMSTLKNLICILVGYTVKL